jgi:hypothetical protein
MNIVPRSEVARALSELLEEYQDWTKDNFTKVARETSELGLADYMKKESELELELKNMVPTFKGFARWLKEYK